MCVYIYIYGHHTQMYTCTSTAANAKAVTYCTIQYRFVSMLCTEKRREEADPATCPTAKFCHILLLTAAQHEQTLDCWTVAADAATTAAYFLFWHKEDMLNGKKAELLTWQSCFHGKPAPKHRSCLPFALKAATTPPCHPEYDNSCQPGSRQIGRPQASKGWAGTVEAGMAP